MRAVIVGLVGAVLAAGGAQAKVCRLDGLEVVATSRGGDNVNPELIGARFKVVKKASAFKTIPDEMGSLGTMTTGWIEAELNGVQGRYVVHQSYIPHSSPWIGAGSTTADDPDVKTKWGKRDRAGERKLFERDGTFDVYSGPLAGLTLEPTNCHSRGKRE
ncbi:hypothetical protein [Methylobacterium nigriterrae]|uniref:hypothetical protein n=1 Tax=Methylobacterium nigriterrae TaxID=3127512 RepID=UPI00301418C9